MGIVSKKTDKSLLRADHPLALWGLVAMLVLMLFACYHLYVTIIADPAQQRALILVQQGASSAARSVDRFILEQQQQLQSLAARPLTSKALSASEPDRRKLEASVTELLNGAQYSRLVVSSDTENSHQLNFVALDLARRVLSGETVAPEAMRMNNQWHILMAVAVGSTPTENNPAEQVTGCLLASFPADRLAEQLAHTGIDGQAKLLQKFPGIADRAFASHGTAESSSPSSIATTKLPHWQVEFKPALQQLRASGSELWLFYAVLAVTLLLIIWLLTRLTWQRNTALKAGRTSKREQQQKEAAELASATSFLSTIPSANKKEQKPDSTDSAADNNGDDKVFDLAEDKNNDKQRAIGAEMTEEQLPESIFRAYDIRGISGEQVTEALATNLGMALGTLALQRNQQNLVTAHDGRTSSPALYRALLKGIRATGCDVIGLGQAPTPLMNFVINYLEESSSGVMVTASHNPPQYNGFKMSIEGVPLTPEEITGLRTQILQQNYLAGNSEGEHIQRDLTEDYIQHIVDDAVPAEELSIVVDASNGVTGPIAPQLLEQMGCDVSPLYCDVDGTFPNHSPDTSVAANLQDLIQVVQHQSADLGFAFDGDGDRIVAVTGSGRIVWPDELLMIFARDLLSRQPGADIVFDIKSTNRLKAFIGNYGGRPVLWKTGHSFMREKMRELDAPLGGEYSGHIFFNDRWFGFDDGMYAAARLVEIISLREQTLDEILDSLPTAFSSNEHLIQVPEQRKFSLIDELSDSDAFDDCKLITIDGLRIEFGGGWGLVRASNTSPALTLRFEGSSKEDLKDIRERLKAELLNIEPNLNIDF